MTGLFEKIESATSSTKIKKPHVGFSIIFSNTGQRSDGWFVLTADMVLGGLNDILMNIDDCRSTYLADGGRYIEKSWRELFGRVFSDPAMMTIGRVQTYPAFSVIAKIIHYSNTDTPYRDRHIDIDEDWINNAILEFSSACYINK